MDPVGRNLSAAREEALARVLAYRERGRGRSRLTRLALATLGGALLIASVPLVVVLPEIGIPALLIALRLLAVEVGWAARAYVWIDWRFAQARQWFHRQSVPVRAAVLVGFLVLAVALVLLLVHEFF